MKNTNTFFNGQIQAAHALSTIFTQKWISFSAPPEFNYEGIKCTATMNDGTILRGEFNRESKAFFHSFAGSACVKFEVEDLDHQEQVSSGADKLLKELEG